MNRRRRVSISTQRHGELVQSFTSEGFAFQQKASLWSIGLLSVAKADRRGNKTKQEEPNPNFDTQS